MNLSKLKNKISKSNKTSKELADFLGISILTLDKKINGKCAFTTYDAYKLCELLKINNNAEKIEIFLL